MVKRLHILALILAAVLAVFSYPVAAQETPVFDYNPPSLNASNALKRSDLDAELDGINAAKQAVDADLTCLAGLTSAADKLAYFTGSGTCATTDFSSFARTLVDDADAATARTTLGLVIGTNVQAFDADLTTWSGVTPSANGQNLVSAADYAAMRTALSLVPGTNVQAFDADLSTWATLTPSANAQSLVTAADYADMRTQLSLVAGTNVQAFDADLSTWATVTPSANGQSLVAAADYAAMRGLLDLEAGTDFYSIAAADAAFLSASEIDTGSEIAAIVAGETGTGELVFDTSPTLKGTPVIGDGAGNDKLAFTPETSDPTCSAGDYFLWANSTGAKLKKCQDGVVTDLAPAGGGGGLADAYDRMTDGTTTATASSNDIFKFRGANGIAVTVQSNDVTHGDNVLIDGSGAGDVDGPASAADNAITRYDGTTGKIVQDSGVTISDGGEILAVAGTTTEAPIKLQAGTNLTAAEDGAIEMDGEAIYATTDADNRGVVRVVNYIAQDSTRTLTSNTTEQAIFDETTNGRITLETGLYRFECQLSMGSMSATSGNAAFDLMGTGSATLGSIAYSVAGIDAASGAVGSAVGGSHHVAAQTGNAMVTAATGTALGANIRGSFRVTAAGTLVPSVTLQHSAAATVLAGSYCGFERMGGSATSVGQWD